MDRKAVEPQLITRIDLDAPLPSLPDLTPGRQRYRRALILVVLHGVPVSVVEVEVIPGMGTSPALLAALIWPRIRAGVNAHLLQDGLDEITALDSRTGIEHRTNGTGPKCRTFATSGLSADDVSVVIPTIGASPVLGTLVQTLLTGVQRPGEILVSLNGPVDRSSAALVKQLGTSERVRVVRAPGMGAALARNAGAGLARGRVLAFLDDDVEVDRHWLQGVLRGFGRSEAVSCVTGLILPSPLGAPAQLDFRHFGELDTAAEPALFDTQEHAVLHALQPYLPGVFGAGANLAIRKEAFESLGGFDERLGPGTARGGEDIDLLLRAALSDRVIAYEPQALVHHHRRPGQQLRRTMFGYGEGLGAVLLKQAAQRGGRREIVRHLPQGIRYFLAPSSPKNTRTGTSSYPASLKAAELAGVASALISGARTHRVSSSGR